MSYVYLRSEPGIWTVGFYTPCGVWQPESDHGSREEAAARVARLNGADLLDALADIARQLEKHPDFCRGNSVVHYCARAARAAIAKATGA